MAPGAPDAGADRADRVILLSPLRCCPVAVLLLLSCPCACTAHTDIVASGGCLVKIPIQDTYVRSLNQSVCVGVGLFEALRQLDSHAVAPRDDAGSPAVKLLTPMQLQQQQQVGA